MYPTLARARGDEESGDQQITMVELRALASHLTLTLPVSILGHEQQLNMTIAKFLQKKVPQDLMAKFDAISSQVEEEVEEEVEDDDEKGGAGGGAVEAGAETGKGKDYSEAESTGEATGEPQAKGEGNGA